MLHGVHHVVVMRSIVGRVVNARSSLTVCRRTFSVAAAAKPVSTAYTSRVIGEVDTPTWRLFVQPAAKTTPSTFSPWHDIPLHASPLSSSNVLYHYINEIPIGTTAKMEMSTTEENAPIKQDVKKGKLRHFTYGTIPFNYGALSQTWEDPSAKDEWTGLFGDNDPIDVVEISGQPIHIGAVHRIRIFGSLALIDEGETDWKVIGAIETANITTLSADTLQTIREWFRMYKTTDGKAENTFARDGELFNVQQTIQVINSAHARWKALVEGEAKHNGLALPAKHRT